MAIVQISKIQHRTGSNADLPQLDVGEIGFASDEQKVYIGNDATLFPPANAETTTQTEILTEVSRLDFGKIEGANNTTLNLSNVVEGQLLVSTPIIESTGYQWINAGGNAADPGNIDYTETPNIHLGNIGNVKLGGGTNGYVLQTDGTGNLAWAAFLVGDIVSGTPGGASHQLQFNDGGTSFGGSANLTFNKITSLMTLTGNLNVSNINGNTYGNHNGRVGSGTPNSGAFTSITASTTAIITGNVTAGNINSGNVANIIGNIYGGNIYTAGTAQVNNLNLTGNVTSNLLPETTLAYDLGSSAQRWKDLYLSGTSIHLGAQTLTSTASGVSVTGTLSAGSITTSAGDISATTLTGSLTTAAQPNVTSLGTLTGLTVSGMSDLGDVANVAIQGGSAGYVLTTDGAGVLAWTPIVLPSSRPGGANTQLQFNDSSSFSGSTVLTFDKTSNILTVPNINVSNVSNLGPIGNVRILGGTNGQFLKTNGTGTLAWSTGGATPPGGANSQVQWNLNGVFSADNSFKFFLGNTTLSVPNINSTVVQASQPNITSVGSLIDLTVVGNMISGNANLGNAALANYFIGSGALLSAINGANVSEVPLATLATNSTGSNLANYVTNVVASAQSNITSLGTLTALTVTGITNLGSVANVRISGGTTNQVLSTNGSSELSWISVGAPGGDNTFVQFNNSSTFGGSANFTFDRGTNTLAVTNLNATLTASASSQINITSVGTLANLTVTGNITTTAGNLTSGNANLGNAATASYFIGSGNNLSNIQGANVTGTAANANYAAYAGNITEAAQSNITSVGTLGNLSVTSNISVGNVNASYLYGDGTNLTSLPSANISGEVANANYASYAGTVTGVTQSNISGLGNLLGLTVKTSTLGIDSSPAFSAGDIDAVRLVGHMNSLYISTDNYGFSMQTESTQSGGGFYAFGGSTNLHGAALLAPNLLDNAVSDIVVIAKEDSASGAIALMPSTDLTTSLGAESDNVFGQQRFRNIYGGDVTISNGGNSVVLMAGTDGLYLKLGTSYYKIDMTAAITHPDLLGPSP